MPNHKRKDFPKMLSFILIFLSILFFIPNVTMYRIVEIGPFKESLAIFFFPFVYSIADAITEEHGQEKAIYILFSCYLISIFFSIILMLSCYLPFPLEFENQEAYNIIFKKGPYIIFVGLISVGISMYVNIRLMEKLRIKLRNKHFIIRSIISSSIGEFIVTLLAYPLIFMQLNSSLISLMVSAYAFKVIYSIGSAFPAKFLVFLMRKIDGSDYEPFNREFQSVGYTEQNKN